MVSCPLLPLSVGTDTPGRRRQPLSTLTSSVNLASSGEPLYRRKVCRLLTVKKKGAHRLRRAEVSRQLGNVNSKCEKNIKKYNQASRANSSRHSANTISAVFQPNISRG